MKFISEFINLINTSRRKRRYDEALLDDNSINTVEIQSSFSFRRVTIFGVLLGLIAFFVPFMRIDVSIHKNEIEELLGVITNSNNAVRSYSLFIFVQLNDIRFGTYSKIVGLRTLIYVMPIILLSIPIFYELNAYTFKKMANVSFIAMSISILVILKNMRLFELEFELGAYLLIICCVILLVDLCIPSANQDLTDANN
jgi:hypothetical protein